MDPYFPSQSELCYWCLEKDVHMSVKSGMNYFQGNSMPHAGTGQYVQGKCEKTISKHTYVHTQSFKGAPCML